MIVSDKIEEIAEVFMARLGRGVTFLEGTGGYSGNGCLLFGNHPLGNC
ncbi:hypothetical protein DOT_3985 [Desulfosporosinus sp. OT]|nr:hypothetical protein DOT_3985 [Desulfosporosinus sp. OT]